MIPHLGTMQRDTTRILCSAPRRDRARSLALVAATSLIVLAFARAAAADGLPPSIGPITQGGQPSGEEVIEAQINTHGQETTWEISLNCPGEPRCQHAEGRLSADSGIQIVSAKFTG